jgi:hypothetical protein
MMMEMLVRSGELWRRKQRDRISLAVHCTRMTRTCDTCSSRRAISKHGEEWGTVAQKAARQNLACCPLYENDQNLRDLQITPCDQQALGRAEGTSTTGDGRMLAARLSVTMSRKGQVQFIDT